MTARRRHAIGTAEAWKCSFPKLTRAVFVRYFEVLCSCPELVS